MKKEQAEKISNVIDAIETALEEDLDPIWQDLQLGLSDGQPPHPDDDEYSEGQLLEYDIWEIGTICKKMRARIAKYFPKEKEDATQVQGNGS